MSQDTIIIVTGSHAAGKFVKVAARRWFRHEIVECNFPDDPKERRIVFATAPLADVEIAIQRGIRIGHVHVENDRIAGILYFHGAAYSGPQGSPLDHSGDLLRLSNDDLFQKCLIVTTGNVVSSDQEILEKTKKFRTTHFDGTHESAWSAVRLLLDEPPAYDSSAIDNGPSISPSPTADTPGTISDDRSSQPPPGNEPPNIGEITPPNDPNHRTYEESGLAARRHANQAVVLIVGLSSHGKSTTINRLVGRNLLQMGRSATGSTTKVIQRVTVPVPDLETGVTVTIAFDDTPGDADTTYSHREDNASLIRQYKQRYFPEPGPHTRSHTSPAISHHTFPNVILLVAAWDSITPDAHNNPEHFTSAVGKSMFNLIAPGLVDPKRTNVIVVVTKSKSSWDQFDDCETKEEKNIQWNIEAGKRIAIILDLQRKVFPKSTAWPVVFIENGGGSKMNAPYIMLPNRQLSHQNLFEAIREVIAPRDQDIAHDLAGIHALRLLSGAEPLDLASKAVTEILLSKPLEAITPQANADIPPSSTWLPSHRIRELVEEHLGVSYNPVSGVFGRTRILDLDPSQIKIKKHSGGQSEEFVFVKDTKQDTKSTATQLRVEFDMRDVAGLSSHYSSSHAFNSALSNESQLYHSRHLISVATVIPLCPQLSREMMAQVDRLPTLPAANGSPEPMQLMQQYHDFFTSYGTHVVLRVALGGVLRVVTQANSKTEGRTDGRSIGAGAHLEPNPLGVGARVSIKGSRDRAARRSSDNFNFMIFRDGGGAVASQLTRLLEQQFAHLQNTSSSPALSGSADIRAKWIDELENDPVFCPDNPVTEYQWLYNLGGLTAKQKEDLRRASYSYLIARPDQRNPVPGIATDQSEPGDLPRWKNLLSAFKIFKTAWAERTKVDRKPV